MSPLPEAITDLAFACKALGIDPLAIRKEDMGISSDRTVRLRTCQDWERLSNFWHIPKRERHIRDKSGLRTPTCRQLYAETSTWTVEHYCFPHLPCWASADPQPSLIGEQP